MGSQSRELLSISLLMALQRMVISLGAARERSALHAAVAEALCDGLGVQGCAFQGEPATEWPVEVTPGARRWGFLAIPFPDGHSAASEQVAFVKTVAIQLAAALDALRLQEEIASRKDELSLLHDQAHALASISALRESQAVLRRVVTTLKADAGVLFLVENGVLVQNAQIGLSARATQQLLHVYESGGPAWQAYRQRVPAMVTRETCPARERVFMEQEGIQSALAVPLLVRGEAVGVLVLSRRMSVFSEREATLLAALGAQLGMAVGNVRLLAEAQRRAEELTLVHEVGQALVATLELDRLLEAGVQNIARIVDCPDAYLLLLDSSASLLEIRAVAGLRRHMLGRQLPLLPPDGSVAARVFHTRVPLVVEDAEKSPFVNSEIRQLSQGRAYLALPLVVRHRAIGSLLAVETRGTRSFSSAEVERAAAISNQLAIALENARLVEDLRQSYSALEAAQQQLVRQERLAALGELAAVIAHEVRNPLGVIFNSLSSVRRVLQPEPSVTALLEMAEEEAGRINRIVGDLLDFARPLHAQPEPESLPSLIELSLDAAASQRRGVVKIEKNIPDELNEVWVDARLLRQALVNLFTNAFQAMPQGGHLLIRAERSKESGICLTIVDSGAGIPSESLHRVFEPFFTTKATGTGLGLALVKRIADSHGGVVEVESQPGLGTTFRLYLPGPNIRPSAQ